MKRISLAQFEIGQGAPVFIIAEAGVNHNGDRSLALRMIDEAADVGANAIKFQTFLADELVTQTAPKAVYQTRTTDSQETQYDMLKRLELAREDHEILLARCQERGILFFSTPYDKPSVDLLDKLEVPAYKISSSDVTNIPFLRYIGQKKRPVLLSTGMSTLGEVEEALAALRIEGLDQIALLHCTSEYPAPVEESNLNAIATLKTTFDLPVGFSDHTPGVTASTWAVAVGACMIEKHFTLDHTLPGPDHTASLEPAGFKLLVDGIRQVERALGDGIKRPTPSELKNKPLVQKGLVARRPISKGERFLEDALTCKRPVRGLLPRDYELVLGQTAARDIEADEPIRHDCIRWE